MSIQDITGGKLHLASLFCIVIIQPDKEFLNCKAKKSNHEAGITWLW